MSALAWKRRRNKAALRQWGTSPSTWRTKKPAQILAEIVQFAMETFDPRTQKKLAPPEGEASK